MRTNRNAKCDKKGKLAGRSQGKEVLPARNTGGTTGAVDKERIIREISLSYVRPGRELDIDQMDVVEDMLKWFSLTNLKIIRLRTLHYTIDDIATGMGRSRSSINEHLNHIREHFRASGYPF